MEEKILQAFLYKEKLKFNEITKYTKERSNKIAYHLTNLVQKNFLTKEKEYYSLSKEKTKNIPYLTKKQSPLPVLLIGIGNTNKCFLPKRTKKPFLEKKGLPGGRILLGETIPQATKRIMKEKYNIKAEYKKINSISIEHAHDKEKILHSFILIFVTATTKQEIHYTKVKENKNKTIQSDYTLITKDFNKKTNIPLHKTNITT